MALAVQAHQSLSSLSHAASNSAMVLPLCAQTDFWVIFGNRTTRFAFIFAMTTLSAKAHTSFRCRRYLRAVEASRFALHQSKNEATSDSDNLAGFKVLTLPSDWRDSNTWPMRWKHLRRSFLVISASPLAATSKSLTTACQG